MFCNLRYWQAAAINGSRALPSQTVPPRRMRSCEAGGVQAASNPQTIQAPTARRLMRLFGLMPLFDGYHDVCVIGVFPHHIRAARRWIIAYALQRFFRHNEHQVRAGFDVVMGALGILVIWI